MDTGDVPRAVGLWMAAETQSEINMRHLEEEAEGATPRRCHHAACPWTPSCSRPPSTG